MNRRVVSDNHPINTEEQLIGPAGGTLEDYAQYLGFIMGSDLEERCGVYFLFDPEQFFR